MWLEEEGWRVQFHEHHPDNQAWSSSSFTMTQNTAGNCLPSNCLPLQRGEVPNWTRWLSMLVQYLEAWPQRLCSLPPLPLLKQADCNLKTGQKINIFSFNSLIGSVKEICRRQSKSTGGSPNWAGNQNFSFFPRRIAQEDHGQPNSYPDTMKIWGGKSLCRLSKSGHKLQKKSDLCNLKKKFLYQV